MSGKRRHAGCTLSRTHRTCADCSIPLPSLRTLLLFHSDRLIGPQISRDVIFENLLSLPLVVSGRPSWVVSEGAGPWEVSEDTVGERVARERNGDVSAVECSEGIEALFEGGVTGGRVGQAFVSV